ncbi:hypothetical protein E2562_023672 [Oryza meyeriana var. granulata]|uniref:Uncharacterized protein n=1 Tax=Oryza meyeriana var. granulata TaxID=110450 RepID=A0A6G1BNE9_9ORYZ|nr:hypothetical protein E2562_023672 [Oryza meyeriana var. granulata]
MQKVASDKCSCERAAGILKSSSSQKVGFINLVFCYLRCHVPAHACVKDTLAAPWRAAQFRKESSTSACTGG